MVAVQGKGASGGVAYGKLYFYKRENLRAERFSARGIAEERRRFSEAQAAAKRQLALLQERTLAEAGQDASLLFEIHAMMVEDLDYAEAVGEGIDKGLTAEAAVGEAAEQTAAMFSAMDDDYMQARAADVRDISDRLIGILTGRTKGGIDAEEPVIVVADDLAPSETMQLDKSMVLGFVTGGGSAQGHTAILARTLGLPAVIGAGTIGENNNGRYAWIDGDTGEVYIEPDELTAGKMEHRRAAYEAQKNLLEQYRGRPTRTADGKEIRLYCNISGPGDLAAVEKSDGAGVGLYRTEFLYLGARDFPSEEAQFDAYRRVVSGMRGKPVIIRTVDIGADKQADYFDLAKEENPALGLRGVRLCLARPEVFKTQLRAIYRAAAFGRAAIMVPMICSTWELREVRRLCSIVQRELAAAGVPFGRDTQIGIMVETPAAVMVSDRLARDADFFSIGTNDLLQYTLACDRQNPALGRFYDPHHKALMRMIALTVKNAHAEGKWTGVCGELAADTTITEELLGLGVDELSVTPSALLPLRKRISEIDLTKATVLEQIR